MAPSSRFRGVRPAWLHIFPPRGAPAVAGIATRSPTADIKRFTRRNLFRMRQFYETYRTDEKVSPLVTQLPWTHNLLVLSRCKTPEEREFYLRTCLREGWAKRDLERQLAGALFERTALSPPMISAPLRAVHADAVGVFRDSYLLDFLDLPEPHSEADLQRGWSPTFGDFWPNWEPTSPLSANGTVSRLEVEISLSTSSSSIEGSAA